MSEWFFRIRDLAKFSKREQKELVISSILFGFILSFRMWGGETFSPASGIRSWITATIMVLIVIWFNLFVQKSFSLSLGYTTHHYWWFQGILIALLLAFISYGYIPFIFPGFQHYEHVKRLRLGKYRFLWNIKDMVVPAIAGVFSNIILALIISFFYLINKNPVLLLFIKINFLYAFLSLLPIPRIHGLSIKDGATAGLHIFFFQKPLYAFTIVSVIAYAGLIYLAATAWHSFFILLLALILGLVGMALFNHLWEKS